MRETGMPVLSGVGLIVVCFFASAALRVSGSGWALAEGVGELAAERGDARRRDARGDPASASPSSTPRRSGSPSGGRR